MTGIRNAEPFEAPDPETAVDAGERKSAATTLVEMALDRFTLGISSDGEPYAVPKSGPRVVRLLRGGGDSLRSKLAALYWAKHRRPAPAQALADTMATLAGIAGEAEPRRLHQRVARAGPDLWLDIGDATGRAVKITPAGWSVESSPPVLFRRTNLTLPLPIPTRGSELRELWEWVNSPADDQPLMLAFFISILEPDIPHPILGLFSGEGSGKSSAAAAAALLLDPSPVPLRKDPRDSDSWVTAAAGSWVVAVDNVRSISDWFSDSLCRAVTGEGDVRRRLFTDGDLAVFSFRRVVILTAIDPGPLHGDLADRMLPVKLPVIPEQLRRGEKEAPELWAAAHPRILGALLDFAVQVFAALPATRPTNLPRMADYAHILAATDHVLGTDGYAHYMGTRSRLAADTLTGDPFILALTETLDSSFEGSSAELLDRVTPAADGWRPPKSWPRNARAVTRVMRLHAEALRKAGWGVSDDAGRNKGNAVTWSVHQPEKVSESPSSNSPDSPIRRETRSGRDNLGESSRRPLTRLDSPNSPNSPVTRQDIAVPDASASMASQASIRIPQSLMDDNATRKTPTIDELKGAAVRLWPAVSEASADVLRAELDDLLATLPTIPAMWPTAATSTSGLYRVTLAGTTYRDAVASGATIAPSQAFLFLQAADHAIAEWTQQQ